MKSTKKHLSPFCQKILQFIKKKGLITSGEQIVLAVSGGIDSVVMLDVLVQLKSILGIELEVAHVNHQLRGKESGGDEKFVRKLAKQYDITCTVERVQTKKKVKELHGSLQNVARELRYSFFDTLKKSLKADRVATAHNANDNAETVLMNLLRGTGIDGLQGIPLRRGTIVRPLLCATRKEIASYAKERKLFFREDSSNLKDDYTRNYLRHKIIPKLEKRINPSLVESLLRESEIIAANAEFVDELVENSYDFVVKNKEIFIHQAKALHPFLLQMMIRRLLIENGIEPSFDSIGALLDLMNHQKGKIAEMGNTWIAERLEKSIQIRKRKELKAFAFKMENAGTLTTDKFVFSIKKSSRQVGTDNKVKSDASIEYVDARFVKFPIVIRSWKKGDAFIPLGMKGKKKLSDFLGEQKLSAEEKLAAPVVETSGKIVWVAGRRLDERFKITDSTTETYQLTIKFETDNH